MVIFLLICENFLCQTNSCSLRRTAAHPALLPTTAVEDDEDEDAVDVIDDIDGDVDPSPKKMTHIVRIKFFKHWTAVCKTLNSEAQSPLTPPPSACVPMLPIPLSA